MPIYKIEKQPTGEPAFGNWEGGEFRSKECELEFPSDDEAIAYGKCHMRNDNDKRGRGMFTVSIRKEDGEFILIDRSDTREKGTFYCE